MSRHEKDRQKQIQDKCQNLLNQMLRDEDNKYCVDCDAKGPRWASWNIGIFLCIRCAGIHRNLGVHISKVKSVNLDSWTPEQVMSLEQMGNSRARAVYEANIPDSFRRPQTDSALESFIRAKYEAKKYIAEEWVPPPLPKVNWDKELDEEAERQKKKKRELKGSSVAIPVPKKTDTVIPQALPKPTSSPKNSRGTPPRQSRTSNASADLLGLTTPTEDKTATGFPQDDFTSFLSAEPAAPSVAHKRSEEEESFFNQTDIKSSSGSSSTSSKMTTDSILALYAKAPPVTHNFMMGNPGPAQNSTMFQQSQTVFPPAGYQIPNQFAPMANGALPVQSMVPNAVGMGHPPVQAYVASNPFYGGFNRTQDSKLTADFSGLSIQPSTDANQGATLSNTLWQ